MLVVATWNINSVRLRLPIVERFLDRFSPDILCLQETKCPDDLFPLAPLRSAGYPHIAIHGQKGYNGVAILSRRPLSNVTRLKFCGLDDTRHLSADISHCGAPLTIHNFYVPAGGDVPDREENPKFAHKLDFLAEMRDLFAAGTHRTLLLGDLNIAPLKNDVWSHTQLLNVVSHTQIECQALRAVCEAGRFVDLARHFVPPDTKLYTWWSYRARDWAASDRGRRLDHIWTSADLVGAAGRFEVMRDCRGWNKPSDHVPVICRLSRPG